MARIDMHMHILFDLDDGPRTLADSVAMATIAAKDGTTTIVATPHMPVHDTIYPPKLVYERLTSLQQALCEANIPIDIVPGGELYYQANVLQQLLNGTFLTLGNSRTVLLECPIQEKMPFDFRSIVVDVQRAGYRVVLAHPERITDVRTNPNILIPFIKRGVLMQLTAAALTGESGEKSADIAHTLLTHSMIHIIASDGHGHNYRPPLLSAAYQRAAALIGEQAAYDMMYTTPHALLNDAPVNIPPPQQVAPPPQRQWMY